MGIRWKNQVWLVYLVSVCVGEGMPALDLQLQILLSELIIDEQVLATTAVSSLLLGWLWSQQLRRRCTVESSCLRAAH